VSIKFAKAGGVYADGLDKSDFDNTYIENITNAQILTAKALLAALGTYRFLINERVKGESSCH
jgi:hypothetical protein